MGKPQDLTLRRWLDQSRPRRNHTAETMKMPNTTAAATRLANMCLFESAAPLTVAKRADDTTHKEFSTQGPTLKSPGENSPRKEYDQPPRIGRTITANNTKKRLCASLNVVVDVISAMQKNVASE